MPKRRKPESERRPYRRTALGNGTVPHGHAGTPQYRMWTFMKQRCRNPRNANFDRYGGRGIAMCQEWVESYAAFLADMGPRPGPRHQIDRIDNNGPYAPWNCRWSTFAEQARNRRSTVLLTHNGETMCALDWSRRLGIDPSTIRDRLRRGLTVAEALTPVRK